ncbi:MAG: hypothetical protein ACI4XM_08770 [Candidatus Coprovivens sp.]
MNSKKIIVTSLIVFLLSVFLVSIINKTYSVESQNVVYVEDLKVGDFVPFGTKLIIRDNYHCYSSAEHGLLCNNVYLIFFDNTLDVKYSHFVSGVKEEYLVGSYYDYFAEESDVVGWVFNGFSFNTFDSLSFIPVSSYSDISKKPEISNDYLISAECVSTNNISYSWYFVKNINDYSIYSYDNTLIKNINDNNLFFEEELSSEDETDDLIISYDIDASKGDIIDFESRGGFKYCNLDERCRGSVFDLIDFDKSIYESSLYIDNSIVLDKDLDVLSFRLVGSYGYIRNLKVLTFINEGNQLDLSKVSKGDVVLSKITCGDSYQISSVPLTIDKDYKNGNNNSSSKNPNTSVFLKYMLILLIILLFLNLVLRKKMNNLN